MKLASYLATLNCLEFTFLKGPDRNKGEPVLAAKIGPGGLILHVHYR